MSNESKPNAARIADSLADCERSYRRGFMHGFSRAIDAAERCMTISDMLDYMNNELSQWRESNSSEMTLPPDLP